MWAELSYLSLSLSPVFLPIPCKGKMLFFLLTNRWGRTPRLPLLASERRAHHYVLTWCLRILNFAMCCSASHQTLLFIRPPALPLLSRPNHSPSCLRYPSPSIDLVVVGIPMYLPTSLRHSTKTSALQGTIKRDIREDAFPLSDL